MGPPAHDDLRLRSHPSSLYKLLCACVFVCARMYLCDVHGERTAQNNMWTCCECACACVLVCCTGFKSSLEKCAKFFCASVCARVYSCQGIWRSLTTLLSCSTLESLWRTYLTSLQLGGLHWRAHVVTNYSPDLCFHQTLKRISRQQRT